MHEYGKFRSLKDAQAMKTLKLKRFHPNIKKNLIFLLLLSHLSRNPSFFVVFITSPIFFHTTRGMKSE